MIITTSSGHDVLVDAADFEWLSKMSWHLHDKKSPYARTCTKERKWVRMHRLIMGAVDPNVWIDHVNGNTLDNRRGNLRIATPVENGSNRTRLGARNTSGYRGVSFDKQRGLWSASIRLNGKLHKIGRFETAEGAARAFNEVAIASRGQFLGRLNDV